jgi:hypothetical protein
MKWGGRWQGMAPSAKRAASTRWPRGSDCAAERCSLDRVRLRDLDPRYLRHDEAHHLVDFAHALFDATDGVIEVGEGHFEALWAVAVRLWGGPHGQVTTPPAWTRRLRERRDQGGWRAGET